MQSKFHVGALAFLPFLLVNCAPATSDPVVTFTRTSIISDVQCQTLSLPTSIGATPLPTSSTTIIHDPETTTEPTLTVPSTVFETAPTAIPYTVTSYTTITSSSTITQPSQTTEIFLYDTATVGTLTSTSIICTNGISAPAATITSYSGTYTPISGQPTSITSAAINVTCTADVTTLYTLYPTLTSGLTTYTYTPQTPGSTITSTSTAYSYSYIPPPGTTTITHSDTSYVGTSTTLTISTSCPAITTTTYSAKCAPTNLIGNVNGNHGIHVISNAPGSANVYGGGAEAGEDASKCCQLCVENEGCAAMFAYPAAGNCALVFSNVTDAATGGDESSCGEAFTYGDNGDTSDTAGQGFIVQVGCGSIEAV